MISCKTKWVSTDGWRGYEEPIWWVAGANDTGSFPDSPCKSEVRRKELSLVTRALSKAGIKYKIKVCQSSNVFCVHYYVVVAKEDHEAAKGIAGIVDLCNETTLLYVNKQKP